MSICVHLCVYLQNSHNHFVILLEIKILVAPHDSKVFFAYSFHLIISWKSLLLLLFHFPFYSISIVFPLYLEKPNEDICNGEQSFLLFLFF